MNKSYRSIPPKSSQFAAFENTGNLMDAREGSNRGKREAFLAPLVIFALGFLAFNIVLLIFALYRNRFAPIAPIAPIAPTIAQDQSGCQSLIDKAITYTGDYCDQIDANKGCYGNSTIQAQMIDNASQRFSERGDVADIDQIQSISAAPLNLTTDEWGIALFRVLANLPGSVPGETATLMVFGNTNLDKTSSGLESFYFSSELGQIVCEKVPMDGILVNVPDGAGWKFNVNGTELTLMGNASLRANKNGNMVVSLYSGVGEITANGQKQYFGAGTSVWVNLGGPNGDEAISRPTLPQPLSANELKIACTMTGNYCNPDSITPIDASQAQAIIQAYIAQNSTTTDASTVSSQNTTSNSTGGSTGGSTGDSTGSTTGNGVPDNGSGDKACKGVGNADCADNVNAGGNGKGKP